MGSPDDQRQQSDPGSGPASEPHHRSPRLSQTNLSARCPRCDTVATGRFCFNCGAGLGEERAGAAAAPRGAGVSSARPAGRPCIPGPWALLRRYAPWLIGGSTVAVLLVAVFGPGARRAPDPQGLSAPPRPAATPPDPSTMSPRGRFDRLYQQVITAAQGGDQATVQQLTPMAMAAFGELGKADADARYHLAMLQLHVGDLAGAEAQADSIRRQEPDHLFGYVIGAAVARWTKNDAARDGMYRRFLTRYPAETASQKAEYREHQAMLAEVKRQADSLLAARR